MYARIYLYLLILSLVHTYYYSVLYFSMSHTILLLSFLNRTAGNPTASTHLLVLLLLMHPVMYTAHVHLFISTNRSARRVGVGLD
jgi:hypothetical protein